MTVSKKKKPRRGAPSLKRRTATKEIAAVHWVYCEGKTEKDCIDRLRQAHRVANVQVQVVGEAGVPKTIVEKAATKQKSLRGKGHLKTIIHVVFDRDEHPCFRSSIDRARALGFSIGASVPCIELWAILLHRDQSAHIHRHDAQKLLKKIHPGYCHQTKPLLDPKVVLAKQADAAKRSLSLATRAVKAGDEFSNPSTTFPSVLDAIFNSD